MGGLISRFRGKQTTIDVLEGLDKEIKRLESTRKQNQDRQKKFVTSLLIYSIIVYVISAVVFFFIYLPETWLLRFLYSLPLLVFPFLILGLKKLLHWYFVKRIASNDQSLRDLREKKKQILEDVMETETYKKAKEILEKFDPVRFRKLEQGGAGTPTSTTPVNIIGTPGTVIHQRSTRTVQQVTNRTPSYTPRLQPASAIRPRQILAPHSSTPSLPPRPQGNSASQMRSAGGQAMVRGRGMPMAYAPPPGPPMPRSVLPRERGTMDRLMDYLVGDGPENRYALICRQCYSHNGMALKEEFEYLSFRCCYCYCVNPAKKQRPLAPRLEFFAAPGRQGRTAPTDSQGSGISNEESDDDDVDSEDGDVDNDSEIDLKSNTSAGVPTLKSVEPPIFVPSRTVSAASIPSEEQKSLQGQDSKTLVGTSNQNSSRKNTRETQESSSSSASLETSTSKDQTQPQTGQLSQAKLASKVLSSPSVPKRENTSIRTGAIRSADRVRKLPDFDKSDFFSLPVTITQTDGSQATQSVQNGISYSGESNSNNSQAQSEEAIHSNGTGAGITEGNLDIDSTPNQTNGEAPHTGECSKNVPTGDPVTDHPEAATADSSSLQSKAEPENDAQAT